MLVCPDRECGHRQNVSMETNSPLPGLPQKAELFGDGDKQSYVCRCGFREKAEKFRERTGAGAGMSKRAVQQYLAKQEDAAPAVKRLRPGANLQGHGGQRRIDGPPILQETGGRNRPPVSLRPSGCRTGR